MKDNLDLATFTVKCPEEKKTDFLDAGWLSTHLFNKLSRGSFKSNNIKYDCYLNNVPALLYMNICFKVKTDIANNIDLFSSELPLYLLDKK